MWGIEAMMDTGKTTKRDRPFVESSMGLCIILELSYGRLYQLANYFIPGDQFPFYTLQLFNFLLEVQ